MAVDFANPLYWIALYDSLTTGADGVAPVTLPNALAYRFLRVTASNQNAKDTWRWGGYCILQVNESNPQVEVFRLFCPVNNPIILSVPDYLPSYRVMFEAPRWFDELDLQVDGYSGP